MTVFTQYDAAIAAGIIENDPQQRELLIPMEQLKQQLMQEKKFLWPWQTRVIKGLYLYGDVGAGKTFLMDLFYDQVNIPNKLRFHFHHFMQQIDAQLRRRQGEKNPLRSIARDLADKAHLLCFDEFLVNDVAHAMILAELLSNLLAAGVVLVATSNTPPDKLYWNGVQRQRFLPAIAAIKAHCTILNAGTRRDYRLGRKPDLETWITPCGPAADKILERQFNSLEDESTADGVICVQNREIPYIKCGKRAIWFDFQVIGNLPRSQLDYLEIADKFDCVFVSNIPRLSEKDTVAAILLIHFIDVMYDRHIHIILSAAVPLEELYQQGEMLQTFKRTYSRMREMQSADFSQRHHWHKVAEFK